jgi:cyclopropane fatty-acyl-phospholipid synthase-like methyltransferase
MTDPARLVASGYDEIGETYLSRFGSSVVREKWLGVLTAKMPAQGHVLDLGCGAGIPVARELAAQGFSVVGVDVSSEQTARARANVPGATFVRADMSDVMLDQASFDGIGAFYAITHVPATEQGALFKRIASWLKPGGVLVASLGTGAEGDWIGEWLGTTMFFSHNSEATSLALLRDAGLAIEQARVEQQDNEQASFLWVVAVRPSPP